MPPLFLTFPHKVSITISAKINRVWWQGGGEAADQYCSQPPGGNQDVLALAALMFMFTHLLSSELSAWRYIAGCRCVNIYFLATNASDVDTFKHKEGKRFFFKLSKQHTEALEFQAINATIRNNKQAQYQSFDKSSANDLEWTIGARSGSKTLKNSPEETLKIIASAVAWVRVID